MTLDLLAHLHERYAFDGTPLRHDLGAYHVAFDSMIGKEHVEAPLAAGALSGHRVALIAETGAGKSSAISYVLGPDALVVAPILVPVHPLGRGASTPDRVANEILLLLERHARGVATEPVTGTRRRVTEVRRRSRNIGLNLEWLKGERATEVGRQTETESLISLREKSEVIDQIFRGIHEDGLQPVIIFDDSDQWLAGTHPETVPGFFRGVVRWLTNFPVSVVVATHARYLKPGAEQSDHSSADLLEFLDTRIEIPRVPSAEMLARILGRRITCNVEDTVHSNATLPDAVTEQAIEALFDYYSQGAPLRKALQTAHIALADAVSARAEAVQASHVEAAQKA